MEDIILKLLGSLGIFGTFIIIIIYSLDKFPNILSNFNNLADKNLKSLSDLTQGNYLDSETSTLISNTLTEIHLQRLFKKPITLYEIQKINYLQSKLNKKTSTISIVAVLEHLNLESIDNPENLTDFNISELEKMAHKLGEYLAKAYFIPLLGLMILALVTPYTGFNKETYNLLNSWTFFSLYNIACLFLAYPFIIRFLKFRRLYKSRAKAFYIKKLLIRETNP